MNLGRGLVVGGIAFVAGVVLAPGLPNAVVIIGAAVIAWLVARGGPGGRAAPHVPPRVPARGGLQFSRPQWGGPPARRRAPPVADAGPAEAVVGSHRAQCPDCGAGATVLVYASGRTERVCDRCGRSRL